MHRRSLWVTTLDLISPSSHGRQVATRLLRQDLAKRLGGRRMKVGLGDGGDNLVTFTTPRKGRAKRGGSEGDAQG